MRAGDGRTPITRSLQAESAGSTDTESEERRLSEDDVRILDAIDAALRVHPYAPAAGSRAADTCLGFDRPKHGNRSVRLAYL